MIPRVCDNVFFLSLMFWKTALDQLYLHLIQLTAVLEDSSHVHIRDYRDSFSLLSIVVRTEHKFQLQSVNAKDEIKHNAEGGSNDATVAIRCDS